jgi:KipI family sensor histidine kinase inhibitor
VRWAGERAFLVELSSLAEAMSLHARMVADPLGQIDQIAAARTVLLSFATARAARRAAARVVDIDLAPRPATKRRTVDIEVVYDGEDLDLVAEITGLGREAVVAAHQATPWTAAFGGFAPGFAYLIGGDPRLRVPRRDHPRTAGPAGSVALAGEFSAVYPRRSPGGWRLIGRTDAPLWDPSREDPALIAPGDRVRFRAVRDRVATRGEGFVENVPDGGGTEPGDLAGASVPALTVVEPGLLTLIEDLGRPGYADLGVTASGAADTQSARAANRLVGNSRRAAVLETLGGLAFRAEIDVVLALTGSDPWAEIRRRGAGAPDPAATADAAAAAERVDPDCADPVAAPFGMPFLLRPGDVLSLGYPEEGLRTYISVRGGIAAPEALGSRSRDVLGALGPAPLRPGTRVAIGAETEGAVADPRAIPTLTAARALVARGEASPHGATPAAAIPASPTTLRIRFGPRDDLFDPGERAHLTGTVWVVGAHTDRVGARLAPADGARPIRTPAGDLASEGVVTGALQVPPSGEPVLFGADHPVTGGYPVIAVVVDADLPRAAQLRPGTRVIFLQIDSESSNRLTVA